MKKILVFDCDGTLEISGGPIKLDTLRHFQKEGWWIGICGNWQQLVKPHLDNFDFYIGPPKAKNLEREGRAFELKIFVAASLADKEAAIKAGWDFTFAKDFLVPVRRDT